MKNKLLKSFIFIALLGFLTGCMEENEVQGPRPATPPAGNQVPSTTNPTTFIGNYQITHFEAVNPANQIDVMALQGAFNMEYYAQSNKLASTYALEYAGYNTSTNNLQRQLEAQLTDMTNIQLYDANAAEPYYITFKTPLEITLNGQQYKITTMKKLGDTLYDINTVTLDNVSNLVRLCDPTIKDGSEKDCSTPNGAMKYIGYYRVEEITCGGKTYKGGNTSFAGEMTAHAVVGNMVNIPITVKFQIAQENTELANCIFGSNTADNPNLLFYNSSIYQVPLSAATNLGATFASLGLNGIADSDNETVRTTMINYLPKKNDTGFTDMLFNGNKIQLKLKAQQQWSLGNIEQVQKVLTNTPYKQ